MGQCFSCTALDNPSVIDHRGGVLSNRRNSNPTTFGGKSRQNAGRKSAPPATYRHIDEGVPSLHLPHDREGVRSPARFERYSPHDDSVSEVECDQSLESLSHVDHTTTPDPPANYEEIVSSYRHSRHFARLTRPIKKRRYNYVP